MLERFKTWKSETLKNWNRSRDKLHELQLFYTASLIFPGIVQQSTAVGQESLM